jgi:hypothetical protein
VLGGEPLSVVRPMMLVHRKRGFDSKLGVASSAHGSIEYLRRATHKEVDRRLLVSIEHRVVVESADVFCGDCQCLLQHKKCRGANPRYPLT